MSKFFDDTMQGLLEAVAIDKGEIPLVEKEDMPAPTLCVQRSWTTLAGVSPVTVIASEPCS